MALEGFHPAVRAWFAERCGAPTEIQALAWPRILAGEHVLVTAPTGSGKTLTGFLASLDRLLTGAWPGGGLRVLYVSPLKALNTDIERNLRRPLAELATALPRSGVQPAPVRVAVRSGDTPAAERARMLRRPPEILITTPESLNLLLISARAPELFGGLRMLVLDEIHAVAGSKRGTHLITAVERLVRWAGEFQRVAMSATVRPVESVARFVGGWRLERGAGGEPRHEPRTVAIVEAKERKRYELAVRCPLPPAGEAGERAGGEELWRRLAADLAARIGEARSTLVFTNSRRLAEKMTRRINEEAGRELAWSHHGSLSRELRAAVEGRLKAGALPAIVATSSLELGIDVGALDRVALLQAPRSLASAAQRIGRAGHAVGEVSRALFYPTHARDFLDCAVAARAVLEGEIEPVRPVRAPLDLLAQTILACVARETWRLDELWAHLASSEPFHELSRTQFELVVEMLAGRYAEARIEELKPRVAVDRIAGTIAGRPGLASLLARAGGTIPDRGYFQLRLEGSNARLGELDEEFVWERRVGDGFVLGAQAWRIHSITAHEVLVGPARGGPLLAPFWRADARDRGAFFSERVGDFLERAEARLDGGGLVAELVERHACEPKCAEELVGLLREQRAALGVPLPHRHHLVFETSPGRGGDDARRQVVLYTFWGGTVNRPLALALAALWQEREGEPIETLADDDAVLLVLPAGTDPRALLAALEPERCEELLRAGLETTGFFGALFRQNAQRALLLPRAAPSRRTPLWISRQNAKRLLEAVSRFEDFPLVLETWRTCLADEFELEVLRERLRELASGAIRVSAVTTERPSPFAAGLVWRRTNEQMYEDDAPVGRRESALRGDLLREVALAAAGRPAIPPALLERYREKAQRLLPGYPPRSGGELLEWVKERLLIALPEWRALLAAIDRDRRPSQDDPTAEAMLREIAPRLVRWRPSGDLEVVSALETAFRLGGSPETAAAFGATAAPFSEDGEWVPGESPRELLARAARPGAGEPAAAAATGQAGAAGAAALAALVGQILPFHGCLSPVELSDLLASSESNVDDAVEVLLRAERAVAGELVEGVAARQVAARSSFETLLRWRRAAARPELSALPLDRLPLLVAVEQGLVERAAGIEGLQEGLERMFACALPAGLWEREVLPARLDPYLPAWLDALFEESDLLWTGAGEERATFVFRGDLDLLGDAAAAGAPEDPLERRVLGELASAPRGLELLELNDRISAGSGEVAAALWRLAWAGRVSSDAMRTLRQGVLARFAASTAGESVRAAAGSRRGAFRRWQGSRPLGGRWRLVTAPEGAGDPLAEEERNRERARLLLARYGVVCRELLAQELPAFSWSRLARTLRTMELAGEIVAGHFFVGVPGLQFAAPATVTRLREGLPDGAIWWHNAVDPSSLAGVDLPELKGRLPRRVPTSQVVWRGWEVAAVLRRSGRQIELRVPPEDRALPALLAPLATALARSFDPEHGIEVETINGEPAATSAYRSAFAELSVTREAGGLRLRRRWQ